MDRDVFFCLQPSRSLSGRAWRSVPTEGIPLGVPWANLFARVGRFHGQAAACPCHPPTEADPVTGLTTAPDGRILVRFRTVERSGNPVGVRTLKIVQKINEEVLAKTVKRCRERNIIIPTFAQQKDPTTVPPAIKQRLADVGLWDVHPANLFRITWKNEPVERGGLFNQGNWIEFPPELTGVPVRIIGLVGKYFPTGAHKVGAGFGCLVPRLVSGEFDPTTQKAVWPSTGNFCRGGAFDCALLGCTPVAILPEEMSPERFEWLKSIGAEVIATPGCESNVKEIYDKCWEIRNTRPDCVIFNQFEEFGNAIWHYHLTGSIIDEVFSQISGEGDRLAAYISATGSAGTIAAGDFLRTRYPHLKVVATEALQCPTLLRCGFGGHRIEGIGDKHVPWVHNVRNTDMICAVDDEQCMALLRLFNEDAGQEFLRRQEIPEALVEQLPLLGISSICNLVAAIQAARYYEMGSHDVLFTPLTDSMEMYGSRQAEQLHLHGDYGQADAGAHFARYLEGIGIDNLRELNYYDRKMLHNFKYYTWVEQQQRDVGELNQMWDPDFWEETFAQVDEWDQLIGEFNAKVGLG
ncbi:MAG: pyridoxal-phosphate dependent enzyme [bacterium]|nr:pyridoxal-phosphate dependent enzyme [bacterium]